MNLKNKLSYLIVFLFFLGLIFAPHLEAETDQEGIKNAQILADAWVIVDHQKNPQAYALENALSRREMLKIMIGLVWISPSDTCDATFQDLKKDDWGCKYAQTALKLWFIAPNTLFRPDAFVSKAEVLKMIFKAKNIEVPATSDWREWYVKKAVALWYISSFSDYDMAAKRSFIFQVGAKILGQSGVIQEELQSYQKPKVVVSFASAMDEASVLSNLRVYPEVAYTSYWQDEKTLELTIDDLIKSDTDLLVNVFDTALTASGETLQKAYSKTFKIDGTPVIDFVSPSGKITDTHQYITVSFSKPMVSLTQLDHQEKCPIEITPKIDGKCFWITTSTFQFRPENDFPTWGKYEVKIPSGLSTITWEKTINSKTFEIVTPVFALTWVNDRSQVDMIEKENPLQFIFNDEVSLDTFRANFSLKGYKDTDLNISYYRWEDDLEAHKNIIAVFPKTWDWGYKKTYTFTLSKNMTSLRGNVWLSTEIDSSFATSDFLLSYNPVVFLDPNASEKFEISNLKNSASKDIITPTTPSIILNFYKEVSLDPSLFESKIPFELHYVKNVYDEKWVLYSDKKSILLTFLQDLSGEVTVKLNLKKFSSSDLLLKFSTKSNNQIISYKQIDYKKACLETKNDLWYPSDFSPFTFDSYGKILYISPINTWSNQKDCAYQSGKYKYLVVMNLNPSTKYTLKIGKWLLDNDNYPLEKETSFSFTTSKAQNEDKQVSLLDPREHILVPSAVTPLTLAIQTMNLSQVSVKVCEWDLDITQKNSIKNETCILKTLWVNNLWFKPNITILDLEKIYGKQLEKKFVRVEVQKLPQDKTDYEAKNDYYIAKTSFLVSDIGATLKSAKNSLLWLHDFSTGTDLSDEIETITSYKQTPQYSPFGNYEWETATFVKNLSFTPKENGLYLIGPINTQILLITLKNGEQILIDDVYQNYNPSGTLLNYITTDKPVYKAWELVQISWIARNLSARGLSVSMKKMKVLVRDSQYKEVFSQETIPNTLGAFDFSFELPSDAKLGNYTILIGNDTQTFGVEEYEKPDFKVQTSSVKPYYTFGNDAVIEVQWEYYIGLPVSQGEGSYTLSSTPFYFDGGKTTWYTFGEEVNNWWGVRPMYSKLGWVYYGDTNQNESVGKFILWDNGKKSLKIPLPDSKQDKIYTLSTTLTDPNTKKSIATSTTFTAVRSEVFLGMKFDKYFYEFQDTANLDFVWVDIEGNKKSNQKFTYKVYKVEYVTNASNASYNTKDTLLLEKHLTTGTNGITLEKFHFDQYGEYRFEISNGLYTTTKTIYVSGWGILRPTESEHTLEILSDKESYTVGEKAKFSIASPLIGAKALLTIEKWDEVLAYKVLDITSYAPEIELEVKKEYLPNFSVWISLIQDVATSSEALKELKILRTQMWILEQKLQKENNPWYVPYRVYDLSIFPSGEKEDYDLKLLKELAQMREKERELLNHILPTYFTGQKDIKVDLESIWITSKVMLDKSRYLPGEKQKIELTLKDYKGNPINGEVSLAIVDQSLLAIKNNFKSIQESLYEELYLSVGTHGNLQNLLKRIEWDDEDTPQREELIGWRGGGGMVSDEAMPEFAPMADMDDSSTLGATNKSLAQYATSTTPENHLRTEFTDLAYYKTKITVKDGKAVIEVPKLPDNLTTWAILGYAYTAESFVGNFESTFVVQKDLSLLPQVPRFFLDGDRAEVGALVVNNTSSSKEVRVSLDIEPLTQSGVLRKTLTIGAGESMLVSFPVYIDTKNLVQTQAQITLSVVSGTLSDAISLTKPIYPSLTSEYVFTNGSTDDLSYEEKLDFSQVIKNWGVLELSLGASILTNITKNLDTMLLFPSDDLSSKITFLENALALQTLYTSLGKWSDFDQISLSDFQKKTHTLPDLINLVKNDIKNYLQPDGGLAYYKDCTPWYGTNTCSSLSLTKDFLNLDITVAGIDNTKILQYYKKGLAAKIEENKQYNAFTSISDFLPIALYKDVDFIKKYFSPKNDLSNMEKLDYIELYQLLGTPWEKSEVYFADLKNAILIEARGSVLPATSQYSRYSDSLSNAKMIQILLQKWISQKLLTENLVRFILANRDESGNFYTSHFGKILQAMSAYLSFIDTGKNTDFSATAYLNSKEIMTTQFDPSRKYEVQNKVFSLKDTLSSGENSLGFEKTWDGTLYYDIGVRYMIRATNLDPSTQGIVVARSYYDYDAYKSAYKKECMMPWWYFDRGGYCINTKVKNIDSISQTQKWKLVVGEIQIIVDRERTDVVIQDYLPAGMEILNTNFDTTSSEVKDLSWTSGGYWYGGFDRVEQKDDRVSLYAHHLNPGTYTYTYVMRASYSGTYVSKPATAQLFDTPEVWGRSAWWIFEIFK